ncbi:MAG: hypothetical protein ABSH51_28805 [Solirubrobacteraceae bacterium]|jgi:uncharacterized protein YggE
MWKTAGTVLIGAATLAIAAPAAPALGAAGGQISVNGSGEASVPAGATYGQQQAAYDQALSASITDASSKAQLVAQQLSLTLGPVISVTEESFDDVGYCGIAIAPGVEAPTASGVSAAPSTSTTAGSGTGTQLTPIPAKSHKHKAKKHARRASRQAQQANTRAHAAQASDQSCQLEADVTIVYSTG